jgi:hypothetical protein
LCARVAHSIVADGRSSATLYGTLVVTLGVLANIDVDDLAKASDFYCSALGLRIGRRFGDSAVELLGASTAIYLLKKDRARLLPRNRLGAASTFGIGRQSIWTLLCQTFSRRLLKHATPALASKVMCAPITGAASLPWPIRSGTGSV